MTFNGLRPNVKLAFVRRHSTCRVSRRVLQAMLPACMCACVRSLGGVCLRACAFDLLGGGAGGQGGLHPPVCGAGSLGSELPACVTQASPHLQDREHQGPLPPPASSPPQSSQGSLHPCCPRAHPGWAQPSPPPAFVPAASRTRCYRVLGTVGSA